MDQNRSYSLGSSLSALVLDLAEDKIKDTSAPLQPIMAHSVSPQFSMTPVEPAALVEEIKIEELHTPGEMETSHFDAAIVATSVELVTDSAVVEPVIGEKKSPTRPGRTKNSADRKPKRPKIFGRNEKTDESNVEDGVPRNLDGFESVVDAFPKKAFSAEGAFTSIATSSPLPERDEELESLASAESSKETVDLSGFDPSKYLGTNMERIASASGPNEAEEVRRPELPRPASGPTRPVAAPEPRPTTKDPRVVMQMLHELSQLKNPNN